MDGPYGLVAAGARARAARYRVLAVRAFDEATLPHDFGAGEVHEGADAQRSAQVRMSEDPETRFEFWKRRREPNQSRTDVAEEAGQQRRSKALDRELA